MTVPTEIHYVLPASVPVVAVVLLAIAALAAWAGMHSLKARMARREGKTALKRLLALLRVCVGFFAIMAVAQVLMRMVVLATNWPLWPIALGGATAVEILLSLYSLERQTVNRKAGLALLSLRLMVLALALAMLTQPVRVMELQQKLQRYVAVLLDDSASMYVADRQLTVPEKLRLAETFSLVDSRRPGRLDEACRQVDNLRQKVMSENDWLAAIKEPERAAQLESRRKAMQEGLQDIDRKLAGHIQAVAVAGASKYAADSKSQDALADVKGSLEVQARKRIADAAKILDEKDPARLAQQYAAMADHLTKAAAAMKDMAPKLQTASDRCDQAFYDALAPELRGRIDALALKPRIELARELLLHHAPPDDKADNKPQPSLLDRLQDKYQVQLYKFAGSAADVGLTSLGNPSSAASMPATRPADERLQTDIAAAIDKAVTDIPLSQLAGVVVLSDGRHNAPARPETLAARLALQGVPVSSIVIGSEKPPCDAAIVSLDAPDSVYVKDKMYVSADLKLDGLPGKSVKVTLLDVDRQVDTRTVNVPAGEYRYRTKVQLADEPKDTGMHAYRLTLEKFEGEVFTDNNEYSFSANVTEDRTKLLVIEGRPRWEFRYLKNLFADRDQSVKLQYVLLQPDPIDGKDPRPKVAASVSREAGQIEATALPGDSNTPMKDEDVIAEWMKFDVIILGDVAPSFLRPVDMEAIRRFVMDRGGTLIVIAGRWNMPHDYLNTPLGEMLPVTFSPLRRAGDKSPNAVPAAAEPSFRFSLTAEGSQSVLLRQAVDREENLRIWSQMPESYWRYPIDEAKPGSLVLAYATPPSPPKFLEPSTMPGGADDEEQARKRRDFQRQNALIAVQNVAMGQVMFLGFDSTWRLRYREGDKYHHKFWGQVLRWATASKLPSGTDLVKIGADRSRYAPHSSVLIRSKILRPDFSPVVSQDVAVKILTSTGQTLLRRKMQYIPNSAGMYSADLGELPSGSYKAELDSPDIAASLAAEKLKPVQKIATEFSVDPYTPAEQVELEADRGLLSRLASLGGGVSVSPAQARDILDSLGKGTQMVSERRQYVLWDSWPLLVLMVLLVTVEWLLRKKVGLP